MTGSKNSGGPKESDNGDRSLRSLIVALAIVGAIAGSVILFAYASSDSQTPPDEKASTIDEVVSPPEEKPEITEGITDEPAPIERIEYINSTSETEEDELPVYPEKEAKEEPSNVNTTAGVEKRVPYTEQEQPMYTNDSSSNLVEDSQNFEESRADPPSYQDPGDEPQAPTPTEPDEQENKGQNADDAKEVVQDSSDETDEPELQDVLPKRVLDLLNKVIDIDDDDDDDKNKGKGHKGDN
jgi:hypothetical protein